MACPTASPRRQLLAATVTPLASIFGSGFLVIVPILNGAVGPWSLLAMALVCAVAFGAGGAIRHNIRRAEPALAAGTVPHRTQMLERASDLALLAAYIISVCLYVSILASFLLRGLGDSWDTLANERLVSVTVITGIGLVGYTKGLQALAKLETVALVTTLAIIVALFVGFLGYDLGAATGDGLVWPAAPQGDWWTTVTVVAGTLIVVQGFETSRYLGDDFDAETRVRSSRLSQLVAAVVYLVFVALATPLMHFLEQPVRDSDLMLLAGKASALLPLPLVVAAVLSQFSAAVADTLGGAGDMEETSKGRIDLKHATLLICGGAVVLCFAPTLTILALASRAFAFYYLLQCLVAADLAETAAQRLRFRALAAVMGFVTLFAAPAG